MTREEIVKRSYKKYPQDIIEIINDDGSITREDCNYNLRNVYMQGLIDNNYLANAVDFILEREQDNDYICERLHEIPKEFEICANDCQNMCRNCVLRFLENYKTEE